jgi:hypothetical protein
MNVVGNGVTVLPEMDTGEGLDAMAVSDDEDGSADEEFAKAEVETTAEVDVVVVELESVLAPVVSEFAIDDEELELDNG